MEREKINQLIQDEVFKHNKNDIELMKYNIAEEGVYIDIPEEGKFDDKGMPVVKRKIYAHTPIFPSELLTSADGKVIVTLKYFMRGQWLTAQFDKKTISNKSSILDLANVGISVTSENAKLLVQYLDDVIRASQDIISWKHSVNHLGWLTDGNFSPYDAGMYYDGDIDNKDVYDALTEQKGTLEEWVEFTGKLREREELRMLVAASLAAPLVEVCNENPFIVHLWGTTGGGKTVSLIAAMSVWGNPVVGKLTQSCNGTLNAMLTMAGFMKNLPYACDELQTIRQANTGKRTSYDKLIMQLAEGVDRSRMVNGGAGLNKKRAWKTAFLFSGEEPIVKSRSGGGAVNRVIEVNVTENLFEDGNAVVEFYRTHYGTVARPWVQYIKTHRDLIQHTYRAIKADILEISRRHGEDTTEKQAGSLALILTADSLANRTLFKSGEYTVAMACKWLKSKKEVQNESRAYDCIMGWIAENESQFHEGCVGRRYGGVNVKDGCYCIYKETLTRVLDEAGFDFDSVKVGLRDMGALIPSKKGYFTHSTRICGQVRTTVNIRFQKPSEENEEESEELPI